MKTISQSRNHSVKTSRYSLLQRAATRLLVAVVLISASAGRLHAQGCLTNSLVINTGYDPVTNAAIAPISPNFAAISGHTDPHWKVTGISGSAMIGITSYTPGGIPVPTGGDADVVDYVPGWATFSGAPGQMGNWINCLNSNYFYSLGGDGPDSYSMTFSRSFYLCGSDSVNIDINIACDNYCSGISIDGNPPYYAQASPGLLIGLTSFLSAPTSMTLSAGWHTINVSVVDYGNTTGPNYDGLAIWGTVSSATGTNSIVGETKGCDSTACITKHPCADNAKLAITTLPSSNAGCNFIVTASVSSVYSILGYQWTGVGPAVIHHNHTGTDNDTFSLAPGTSAVITCVVYIVDSNFTDSSGPCCQVVLTQKVTCPGKPTDCCFDSAGTYLTSTGITDPKGKCIFMITAHKSLLKNCKFIGYIWQTPSVTTGIIPASTRILPPMPPSTATSVTVYFIAIDANGDTCKVRRDITVTCNKPSTHSDCCFDSTGTRLTATRLVVRNTCMFVVTAHKGLLPGCKFLGYIWSRPGLTTPIVPWSVLPVPLSMYTSTTITVTFLALDANGDTCKVVRKIVLKCTPNRLPSKSAIDGGEDGDITDEAETGDANISVFPNPTDNAVTVTSTTDDVTAVEVIDMYGKKVGDYTAQNSKTMNVSLQQLPPGTYIFRINNSTSKVVTKK